MGWGRGVALFACVLAGLVGASLATAQTEPGGITFDGTWEGANPAADWLEIHTSFAGGAYTFVKDPTRSGTVARVTLPPGGLAAIEAIHHRPLELGSTTVYGLAFKFPRDWNVPREHWGCLIAQLAYPLLKYTNIGLAVGANYVGLEMHTGYINWRGRKPSADAPATFDLYRRFTDPRGFVIPPSRWATGVWHLLVIQVRWAMGKTGSLTAWHQVEGERSWTRTVNMQDIPTMQWGYGITGAYMSIDGKDAQGVPREVSDKVGAYRYEGSNPVEVYNDGLLVGTSMEAVAARLQGTSFQPVIVRAKPKPVKLGRPYTTAFQANGGVLPVRWSIVRGTLPPGLRLAGRSGAIVGRAKKLGRWPIVLTARDALGAEASRSVVLRVVS